MKGHMDVSNLKTRLFGRLNPDDLVSRPRPRRGKRNLSPEGRRGIQQERTKRAARHEAPAHQVNATPSTARVATVRHCRFPGIQSSGAQFACKPWWPFRIVPSGFGYGISVRLPPRAPHPGPGILGRAPGDLITSNSGIQLPNQGSLLPRPLRERSDGMRRTGSGGDEQLHPAP